MLLKRCWRIVVRATYNTVVKHDGIEHAGYLSFLGLLSAFPFMVFLVALAGFFGKGSLGRDFIAMLRDTLPFDVMQALLPRINEIISAPPAGLLTLSTVAAVWTASSAVEGYRTILNRAYHVGTPPAYIWRRLLSILQLLGFTFVILVGMLVLVFLPLGLSSLEALMGIPDATHDLRDWNGGLRALSLILIFLMIANMYYVLPNIRQTLRDVLPGSCITMAFGLAATRLLTYYLESFQQVNFIYGSLGGIIAVLLFFYLINIIFIFGAELNYLLMREEGEAIVEREQTVGMADQPH